MDCCLTLTRASAGHVDVQAVSSLAYTCQISSRASCFQVCSQRYTDLQLAQRQRHRQRHRQRQRLRLCLLLNSGVFPGNTKSPSCSLKYVSINFQALNPGNQPGDTAFAAQPSLDTQDFFTIRKSVGDVVKRVEEAMASAGLEQAEANLIDLEHQAAESNLWNDPEKAQDTLVALTDAKEHVNLLKSFESKAEDAKMIIQLFEESASLDQTLLEEALQIVENLNKEIDRYELSRLLAGPYDKEGACLYITSGAGGTDAQDWADIILRMYLCWGEKQGYKTRLVEKSVGDIGIKSAAIEFEGRFAYGYLQGEKGTHRLVRQSPFNAKGLRQTSFAGVEVMPLLRDDLVDVVIPDEELEVSFSKAGGKGGQNVNKVETAVRIVHIPTGVAVRCTEERTQLLNKAKALSRLKAKLLVIAQEQRASEIREIRGDIVKAAWGQQIRNYVFHPYKLVRDLRTGFETSDLKSVLDGELGPFIKSYLRHKYENQQIPLAFTQM